MSLSLSAGLAALVSGYMSVAHGFLTDWPELLFVECLHFAVLGVNSVFYNPCSCSFSCVLAGTV